MSQSIISTEHDHTSLVLTIENFKNAQAINLCRKEIVEAKLNQKTIIIDLINFKAPAQTPAEPTSYETLVPMCNLILGTPKDYLSWTHTQTLLQALQKLRQITAATMIVVINEERHLVFEDDAIQELKDKLSQFDHITLKPISETEKQAVMNHYRVRVEEK